MKIKHKAAQALTALALAAAVALGAPAALAAPATIGGADTAQIPVSQELEEENCLDWLWDLLGLSDKSKITVKYLNVKGQGLKQNVRLNLVDCLVGITYTELGSISSYAEVNSAQAAEAWRAQAVAIHSYLEYQGQYGSSANALTYTPVDQIPSSTRKAMEAAIEPVAQELLVYNAGSGYSVCNAVFSCSAGYNTQTGVYGTCSALDAWGTDVPYLQSVESPYEEQYHNLLRRSIGKDYIHLEYNDSRHPEEPYVSADTSHKSLGGFVQYNTLVSNGRSYRYIGQFVSSRYCFDFGADENGTPVMTYYGFGHGVGMSQCGAVGFAVERGYSYRQILQTYYTGAALMNQESGEIIQLAGSLPSGSGSGSGWNLFDFFFGWLF